jgi:hypothetical protein
MSDKEAKPESYVSGLVELDQVADTVESGSVSVVGTVGLSSVLSSKKHGHGALDTGFEFIAPIRGTPAAEALEGDHISYIIYHISYILYHISYIIDHSMPSLCI